MKSNDLTTKPARRDHESAARSSLRAVFIIVASVVLMILVCLCSIKLTIDAWAKKRPMQSMQPLGILTAPNTEPLTHMPAPNLKLDDGHADRTELYQAQAAKLNSYGWVDRSNGIARIPIERAMELVAAQGLPVATNFGHTVDTSKLWTSQKGEMP